jgi:hypothetical protein
MISNSLFVIIPGFGQPHIEHKIQILQSNLQIIRSYDWFKLSIHICVYDNTVFQYIPDKLLNDSQITWIYKKGIVGEYLLEYAHPNMIYNYDYLCILFDDIELQSNIQWNDVIRYMSTFHFDILSPSLTLDSKYQFQYMLHKFENKNPTVYVTQACEVFCYFMTVESYSKKYFPHIEIENPWMWGVDMMLYHIFAMKIGIINHMTMKHHYKNESYNPELKNPFDGQKFLFNKHKTSMEELSQLPAILYIIVDNNRNG